MATLTLSNPTPYQGGTEVVSAMFGYDGSKYRVVRYTFKTGSAGATKVTLSGSITKYVGNWDVSSTYPMRFKITTSSTSHKDATKSSEYDGQITSTSVNVSVNMQLKANTTYYLWLFSGHSSYSLYYAFDSSDNPTLKIVTSVTSYKLTTSAGDGSSITVNRTSSPLGGAATGTITSGATIYLNDVLKITFTASSGYNLGTHTVNGTSFTSGNTHTVTAAVTIQSTATLKSFTLSISAGTGSTITVNRTSSPLKGATTGTIANGATIYYNDVLKITTSASGGYEIKEQTFNGSSFASGASKTVTAAVTIVTTTALMGLVYIDNGTEFEAYLIFIDNGTSWEQYIPYIDNGSGWDICS